MAKDGMGDILTLGLIGAAVYFGWPYISQMLASFGAAPTAPTSPPYVPPAAPPAPPPAQTATTPIAADPCAGAPINSFIAAVDTGVWTPTMTAAANAVGMSQACQNELISQAASIAQLNAAGNQLIQLQTGMSGLGRNHYFRRGSPMRRFA